MTIAKSFVLGMGVICLLWGLSSCGGGDDDSSGDTLGNKDKDLVSQLEIKPATTTILKAQVTAFDVVFQKPGNSHEKISPDQIRWSFSPMGGAKLDTIVDGVQRIKALQTGSLTITVSYNEIQGSLTIDVLDIDRLSLGIDNTLILKPEQIKRLELMAHYSNGNQRLLDSAVIWSLSNEDFVELIESGGGYWLKGKAPGQLTLTAKYQDWQLDIAVEVVAAPISPSVTTLTFSQVDTSIRVDQSVQLQLTGDNAQTLTERVTWQSSNNEIASVGNTSSDKGLVTGITAGEVTITAEYSDTTIVTPITASLLMTVIDSVGSTLIIIKPPVLTELPVGITPSLAATVDQGSGPKDLSSNEMLWESSDPDILAIDSTSGKLSALAEGDATIRVSALGSQSEPIAFTVVAPLLSKISLEPNVAVIGVGVEQLFVPKGVLTDGSVDGPVIDDITEQVKCVSSEPSVLQFTQGCTGKAIALGQAEVSVEVNDDTATYQLVTTGSLVVVSKATVLGHFEDDGTGTTTGSQIYSATVPPAIGDLNPLYVVTGMIPGRLYTVVMSSESESAQSLVRVAADENFTQRLCTQIKNKDQIIYCSLQVQSPIIYIDVIDEMGDYNAQFEVLSGGSVNSPPFLVNPVVEPENRSGLSATEIINQLSYRIYDGEIGSMYTFKFHSTNESIDFSEQVNLVVNFGQEAVGDYSSCSNDWPTNRHSLACGVMKFTGFPTTLFFNSEIKLPEFRLEISPDGFTNEGPILLTLDQEHQGQVIANSDIDSFSRYRLDNLLPSATYQVKLLNPSEWVSIEARRTGRRCVSLISDADVMQAPPATLSCNISMTDKTTSLDVKVFGRDDDQFIYQAASQGGASYTLIVQQIP